mmetsp:Transcript_10122/g.14999  ORF Transcript_10122/g.14999 Transcript_10122/m.14999 type:complete len:308 (-) Transcript_10122:210-1133(-)
MGSFCKTFTVTIFLVPVLCIITAPFHWKIAGLARKERKEPPPIDFGTGEMFDKIASRYDFINRALALNLDMGWRRVMVDEVTDSGELFRKGKTAKVLDLATGTADVAILIGEKASEYVQEGATAPADILGVDPSNNMIEVGRDKVSKKDLSDVINLEIGDARHLDGLRDNTYDAVTMSFGIRNVPEKEDALCEIHRVMKKENERKGISSKLCILEFSEPEGDTIMGYGAKMFIRHVVPLWGAFLSGAPKEYMHLQNSIKHFPKPNDFVSMMESLKCGKKGRGSFRVEEVKQLNFGSVQLYVAKPISN